MTSTGGSRAFLVLRADPVGTGVQVGAVWPRERWGAPCCPGDPRPPSPPGPWGRVRKFSRPVSLPRSPSDLLHLLCVCLPWSRSHPGVLVRWRSWLERELVLLLVCSCRKSPPGSLSTVGRGSGVVMSRKVVKAALTLLQTPFLDLWRRGRGQLDLLGVPFASLKEQVDNEVRLLGEGWFRGGLHVGAIQIPTSGVRTAEAAAARGGPSALRHASQVTRWALPPLASRP